MPDLGNFVGDRNQVVVVDPFYNSVPVIIYGGRIHGAENPPCDGRYGVTVSSDVRGQQGRVFRRLHKGSESKRQRHDRQRLIRKATRGYLCGAKCGQVLEMVMDGADGVRKRGGGGTAPPTLGLRRSTFGKLQNIVWSCPINCRRDGSGSGRRRRDRE